LHRLVDVLIILIIISCMALYIGSSGLLITNVVNTLRVDSYIGIVTGLEISLLTFMLIWAPLVLLKRIPPRY